VAKIEEKKESAMLFERARNLILIIMLGLLGSCGGGGGSSGTPPPLPGSLALTISGLPSGVAASVMVAGPGGFSQAVTASQTLSALVPGSYTVTGAGVSSGGLSYAPAPASQAIAVAAGNASAATVSYSAAALTLALADVANLPGAVYAAAPPGDARLFIVERAGRIRIVQGGAVLTAPFLDISSRVSTQGEGGLLSIAFHPQYASNGILFLYYTDIGHDIVIERHRVSANANLAEAGPGLEIIRIAHPTYTNHYGGTVAFGPDGMLYVGTGDGGGGGDPSGNAQNQASLLGKLLRLDVSASTSLQPYAIPPTNPWFNPGTGQRAEVWALGLRNPWRYTFDSGNLYIADVGQDRREEVNIVAAGQGGLNFGWNTMEGTQCYNATTCIQGGLTLPAFEYDHGSNGANGCSITGGYVYRGSAIAELAGHYFYSDYCKGFLKSFLYAGGTVSGQADWAINSVGNIVSFGRDGNGELLVVAASGRVYRIVRGN
jgi:glucose/arabinose dehydrogenase